MNECMYGKIRDEWMMNEWMVDGWMDGWMGK
jgi:hypothetical protein